MYDKFNYVKVAYNELEQFFKMADKKTKFENLILNVDIMDKN